MTRPGIEPRSPGPLANTLTAGPLVLEIYCISGWHIACYFYLYFIIRFVHIIFFELNAFYNLWHRGLVLYLSTKTCWRKKFLWLVPYTGRTSGTVHFWFPFFFPACKGSRRAYYDGSRHWPQQVAKVDSHFLTLWFNFENLNSLRGLFASNPSIYDICLREIMF